MLLLIQSKWVKHLLLASILDNAPAAAYIFLVLSQALYATSCLFYFAPRQWNIVRNLWTNLRPNGRLSATSWRSWQAFVLEHTTYSKKLLLKKIVGEWYIRKDEGLGEWSCPWCSKWCINVVLRVIEWIIKDILKLKWMMTASAPIAIERKYGQEICMKISISNQRFYWWNSR